MEIDRWNPAWGEPTEAGMRERLRAEGYEVYRYDYPPGTVFPDHSHDFDKKDAVISGSFLLRAFGREFLLGPGDALVIPAGTVHSARVVGNETVISLDASRS